MSEEKEKKIKHLNYLIEQEIRDKVKCLSCDHTALEHFDVKEGYANCNAPSCKCSWFETDSQLWAA